MWVHRPAGSVRATLRGRGGPVLVGEVGVYRPESRRRPVPASGQRCSRAVAGDRARPKPGRGDHRFLPGPAARRRVPAPVRKRQNQRGPGEWVGGDLCRWAEDIPSLSRWYRVVSRRSVLRALPAERQARWGAVVAAWWLVESCEVRWPSVSTVHAATMTLPGPGHGHGCGLMTREAPPSSGSPVSGFPQSVLGAWFGDVGAGNVNAPSGRAVSPGRAGYGVVSVARRLP